jgi:hypothetical protein
MKDSAVTDFPVDSSCWLCLEEGSDESGKPLVRDCSCRGSSGVAHVSCIINYAKSESRRIYESRPFECPSKCIKPFNCCPNCKQSYQNDLSKTLAKVCLEFVENELDVDGNNEFLHIYAMINHISSLDGQDADDNDDAEAITAKFITVQNRLKSKLDEDGPAAAKLHFQDLVANTYATIAAFYSNTESQEGLLKAIEFFEKARDVFKTMDTQEAQFYLMSIDKTISEIHSELSGNVVDGVNHYDDVKLHEQEYQKCIGHFGESYPMTIDRGVDLAHALLDQELRAIEAERLLRKLLDISRLTHGPDHDCTKNVLENLQRTTCRLVIAALPAPVIVDGEEYKSGLFQALRYENDGGDCIVKGPVCDPRKIEEEEEYTVDSIGVIPFVGTPVICHSLQKAAHLNGKIGEVRKGCDKDVDRCVVHFEDEGLKPASVKANNLRVVFDLPNSDDD